jgi:hypothetical protein
MCLAESVHLSQDLERRLQSVRVDAARNFCLTVETHNGF